MHGPYFQFTASYIVREHFLTSINSTSHFSETKLGLINHSITNQRLTPKNDLLLVPSDDQTNLFQLNFGIVA